MFKILIENSINETQEFQIVLEDGQYESVSNIIDEINNQINKYDVIKNKIKFMQNENTKKVFIDNQSNNNIKIQFYFREASDNDTNNNNAIEIYRCLGWCLGCRNIVNNIVFDDVHDKIESLELSITMNANTNKQMKTVPCIPDLKYFVLCIDDFTKSQNDKNIISTSQTPLKLQPKVYPMDDKNMNCIDCSNASEFNGKYTKAEQYAQIELLKNKRINSTQTYNDYLNVNNVLAIIPFHHINNTNAKFSSIMSFDSSYFIKKNRKYFGPVDLTKIKFTLYDDYGNIVDFNECDWNFSLIAKSLYNN